MTQQQLAGRLFVSRELVSKWECGERLPDRDQIENIARALGTDAEMIADREEIIKEELSACVPEDAAGRDVDVVRLLDGFLAGLRQKDRVIFMRRYHFQQSTKEIAAGCGVKENQIRTVLSRTRKKLKNYLKGRL